jgi:branched-chain amino acid transport system substrate-binding protein
VLEALSRVDGDPTRVRLFSAVKAAPLDFGGVALSHGLDKNQGSDQVFLTIVQADGSFDPVGRLIKIAGY